MKTGVVKRRCGACGTRRDICHRGATDAVAGAGRARLRPLLALAPYVARYRGRAILALIALTVAAITTLLVPVAARRMIDFGFSPEGIAMINRYFSVMIAVVAVLAGASASRFYLVMTIGERIVADLRRDVFAHLISLSPAFFNSARSGELISRLTADTTQIKSAVGASVSIALRNLMLFIGATAMMVITSPRLSGFVLLAIPVIVIPLVAFGRWVRRLSRNAQDTLADATAYASELIGAIRTVQAYTSERLANARFGGEVEQAYAAARSSTRARAVLTAIIIFIVFASVVAILWIGSHDVAIGAITPGRLGQFVLYAAFAAAGLGQLSEVWGEVSAASGASERLFEILRVKSAIIGAGVAAGAAGTGARRCRFRECQLCLSDAAGCAGGRWRLAGGARRREGRDRRPLGRGQEHAVSSAAAVLRSGLRHDLVRRRADQSGRSARRCASASRWCRRIRWCSPPPRATTSASAGPRPPISRSSAPPTLPHATEFIRRLPGGFEAQLGERGVTLSGGQRQRIAIARAILRDAPLLLLDEATSSLDAESETLVQTALEELMRHRTTLVIAHRLATVLSCDRIMVMDQGRIVEQGTHASLVAAGGLYARLARLQFEGV